MTISPTIRTAAQNAQLRNINNQAMDNDTAAYSNENQVAQRHDNNYNKENAYSNNKANYIGWVSQQASAEFYASMSDQLVVVKTQSTLAHVDALDEQSIGSNVSIKNAVFLDGTKAGLLEVSNVRVLLVQHPDGSASYFQVNDDGSLGSRMLPGDNINGTGSEFSSIAVVENDGATKLVVTGIEGFSPHATRQLEVDLSQSELSAVTYYHSASMSSPDESPQMTTTIVDESTTNLWANSTLLDHNAAVGAEPTLDQAYDFYSNTTEGKLILDREESHYRAGWVNDDTEELFIARAKYNSGEGGIELFSEFMPIRTSLLGDPAALQAYDEQYELIFTEIKNESKIGETGLPLDPSLQIIIASGLSEAMAQSPERVNDILTDIDKGWTVQYEFSNNGRYTTWQPLFQSQKAEICFKLDALLASYAIADDTYNVIAHEVAHSLDGQGTQNLDGLPSLSSADAQTLRSESQRLYIIYSESKKIDMKNPDTNGLREYSFTHPKEFWADISMFYLSGTRGANVIRNASPQLFDLLTRYYNVDNTAP